MVNSEGNQQIGVEVCVHMGVKVGSKLALAADVGFYERFFVVEAVVLCLAHQGFGNRRDIRLSLNFAVGIDVCNLGIGKAENIYLAVALVNIAGHFSPDYL